MGTLTIRMPDATHERLRQLAKARNISVNKLIEEFSTAALAEFDAETRFLVRSERGSPSRALMLLKRLDNAAAAEPKGAYRVKGRKRR
jgi:hypothetical protein